MSTLREKVGAWITGRKSSANWFLDWAKIASDEDAAVGGVTISNAYKQVAWVNIAIATRARNLARAPLKFYNGDTEVETGPVYDLFRQEGAQLWEATEGWRCIRGEAIWILGWGGPIGFPKKIVTVDPAVMQSKLTPDGTDVALWIYDANGVKIPFKPEEVIHFQMWNPYDSVRGMAELTPVLDELNQEYLMSRGNARLMKNQSIPGGIITIPGDEMSEEQAERVIEKWEKKHKGINRAGSVAVLGSGATYQKIALSPQEMQSFETRGWNRDTILAKFGVPHKVVGLTAETGSLAGKDTAEQMKAFWNLTLLPELNYFEKKLEEEFFTRYNIALTAEFDTTELWEMQADEEQLSNRIRLDVTSGVLTINEARELKGMEPVEWGDTWWRPMSLVDVTEEPEPVPSALSPFAGKPPKEGEEEKPPKEEEPEKSIKSLFVRKGRPSIYTPEYRDYRWKTQFDPALLIESKYTKDLRSTLYNLRQHQLHVLMENGHTIAIQHSHMEELMGEPMWNEFHDRIQKTSKKYLSEAVDITGDDLKELFRDLGLETAGMFDIWATAAPALLDYRVNRGALANIDDTIRDDLRKVLGQAIEQGQSVKEASDGVRYVYNKAQNRAPTIARTEIAGAINDSRVAAFKEEGFKRIEWLSAKDELVRRPPESEFNHAIDGEIVVLGEPFSNGLRWPHDENGEAGNVINCRCDILPVFEE